MSVAKKTLMDCTSNRIYKLETKIREIEQVEKPIDSKTEEVLHNQLEKDVDLESKVRNEVKSLFEYEYFIYGLVFNTVKKTSITSNSKPRMNTYPASQTLIDSAYHERPKHHSITKMAKDKMEQK